MSVSSPLAGAAAPPLHRRVLQTVPTVLVVVVLSGLAYAGHRNGWQIPKFSSLFGDGDAEAAWCEEHGVPEAICIECRPELAAPEPDRGWCRAHGVPRCLWEHPADAQTKTPPPVAPEQIAAVDRALAMTRRPENNPLCNLHEKRIQFASIEAAEKAGVEIAVVERSPVSEALTVNGEIEYDGNRLAQMTSRVPGTIAAVDKQVGDRVRRGEVVALVDSAEVGRAKAEFLQAQAHHRLVHTNLERIRPLAQTGSVPEKQFREAETADEEAHIRLLGAKQALVNLGFVVEEKDFEQLPLDEAAARLRHLGLPESPADDLGTSSNLFPIRAPLDGYVIQRKSVAGEAIDTTSVLFTVADVGRMWLLIDVRSDDVERIAPGLPVRFSTGGANPVTAAGPIAWINTEADHRTRTVKARIELPNADGRLRAHTFGTARIVLREEPQAVVVPGEAVHWEGCCNVVFVRDKNWFADDGYKFFHVRKVRVGVQNGDRTEILAGLLPGEVIASKGSIVLASQLLKAKLGEGCECGGGAHH